MEAYVNGVIWPECATHGATATKGEVVYCFWCTGVPLTAAWTKGQSNVMQPVPKFRSATSRHVEPRLVVKTAAKKRSMKVEDKTGSKLASGPFRLMAGKRFFHDLPFRPRRLVW